MANRQIRNPGQLSRFEASGRISADVPSYAVYTGQAAEKLAQVAGNMADSLGKLADQAAQREGALEGLTEGQRAGAAYLQAQQAALGSAGVALSGPWMEQAKAILRKEEGFRDTPYWDVNANRVGYGSDTHVTADGKIVAVTKDIRITREDAERDLVYRLSEREGAQVRKQLGDSWNVLPDGAKAALASVGYNYGSLPKNVVAAAKTGDLQQLAAAVGSLPSNPERRKREAAIIARATAAPAAGVDPVTTASTSDKPAAAAPAPLSTTPLALRRDGTIRGDAFDDAALSSWSWRMQEGVSTALFAAQQQHENDPAGFAQAAQQIRAQFTAEIDDPQAREMFDKSFADRSEAYGRNVSANYEAKLRQQQLVDYSAGLAARQNDLERQAQVLGANPDGDRIVRDQVATAQASVDGAVAQGILSPAAAQKAKLDLAETAARGRVQGVYDALPTPERKEQFALALLDDWKSKKGVIADLPYDTVKALSDTLRRDAREQANATAATSKLEVARISSLVDDDVASMETSGKGLDPDQSGLTADVVQSNLGEAGLMKWRAAREKAGRLYDATNGMETQSADDINERLDVLKPKPGTVGYADQVEVFAAAQKRAALVAKARADDPAGAVEAAFPAVRAVAEQANPQDPASMRALVRARIDAQTAIGIPELAREPLTKTEALNLARSVSLQSDPGQQSNAMIQLVDQVAAAYGPHADAVLNQVLGVQGIDKEMAQLAAGQFRRISKGGAAVTGSERRQSKVLDETAVSEKSAQAVAPGDAGAAIGRSFQPQPRGRSADPLQVRPSPARGSAQVPSIATPNLAAIQHLRDNPQLASQFDALFGPGAAALYLPSSSSR